MFFFLLFTFPCSRLQYHYVRGGFYLFPHIFPIFVINENEIESKFSINQWLISGLSIFYKIGQMTAEF